MMEEELLAITEKKVSNPREKWAKDVKGSWQTRMTTGSSMNT